MIAFLLTILKIIGLILLWFILIVIGLLLIIFFTPIRYRIKGSYDDKTLWGNAKISWLLKILTINIDQINSDTDIAINIFGIRVNKNKKTNTRNNKNNNEQKNIKNEEKIDSNERQKDSTKESNNKINISKDEKKKKIKKKKKQKKKQKKPKKSSEWKSKYRDIKKFMFDEDNKKAIKKIYKSIKILVKKIFPKKIRLYLKVGTGDPASTGYLLGMLSFLYALKGKNINIEGNFDEAEIKSDFLVQGKLYIITFVLTFIKLFLDKNIRRIVLSK
ncbi:MAG: DUF2953 domain-containing protein [bacterium]